MKYVFKRRPSLIYLKDTPGSSRSTPHLYTSQVSTAVDVILRRAAGSSSTDSAALVMMVGAQDTQGRWVS